MTLAVAWERVITDGNSKLASFWWTPAADEVDCRNVLAVQAVQDPNEEVLLRKAEPPLSCASTEQHEGERETGGPSGRQAASHQLQ